MKSKMFNVPFQDEPEWREANSVLKKANTTAMTGILLVLLSKGGDKIAMRRHVQITLKEVNAKQIQLDAVLKSKAEAALLFK